jgi:hypothetical protein
MERIMRRLWVFVLLGLLLMPSAQAWAHGVMRPIRASALLVAKGVRVSTFWRAAGRLLLATGFVIALTPSLSWACACGCSIFDVGTPSLIPNGAGGTVWFEYDFMNQYINYHATGPASGSANSDKQIKTHFLTVGGRYMFNRDWGAMVTVPYWNRTFRTEGDQPSVINQFNHSNFGDVRIWGMYTGLSEDMSLGLLAGFKLPTGDHTYNHFDRDTSIGTGSTDLLLGAYKLGDFPSGLGNVDLTFRGQPFKWFLQAQYEYPFMSTGNYVPGKEFDGALGTYYNFGQVGPLKELAPMLTLYGAVRSHDQGAEADPPNSGYDRALLAPGFEIKLGVFRLYSDIEFPVFQYYNGDQLSAPYSIKTILSYSL